MLQFNTSQFSYRGKNRFDITYKANSIFSPTKQIVYWYNNMSKDKENYTKKYYELMRESYKNNFNEWQSILNKEHLTFVCYCPKINFCHRFLLKDILIKLGAKYIGEI